MQLAEVSTEQNHEDILWQALRERRDHQARQSLFDLYTGFARALARKAYNRRSQGDLEFADLHQLAMAGLLEAIDGFDPDRGAYFRSYAAHRISGSIADGIRSMSELREQQSVSSRVRRERMQSLQLDTVETLSDRGALDALIDLAMGLAVGFMLEDTGLYLDEQAVDRHARRGTIPYESAAWRELTARLGHELDYLPARETLILRKHYLEGMTFENLARLLGLTKGRVSQMHASALVTLRKRLVQRGHFSLEGA